MTEIAAAIAEWRAAIPVMTEDERRIHDWLMATAGKRRPSRGAAMRFIARDIALGLHRYDPREALADIVGGT